MRKWRLGSYAKWVLLAVVLVHGNSPAVQAVSSTSNSNNYQITETQFGASSSTQSCSGQYCAQASIGDMVAGTSASIKNIAQFGSVTEGEPLLEVIVEPGESNLGVLTTERTASKTTTVHIRNYLSGGYVLQIIGDPPKYDKHALSTPSSPTAAQSGTEQFAINAAANTVPQLGAAPVQVPSEQMSFGFVEEDYRVPNLFKYISGDVIARSQTESGQTNYTISMIVNISNATPAGRFAGDYAAVVIPVY